MTDFDVTVKQGVNVGIPENRIKTLGFEPIWAEDKLVALTDVDTGIEVEVGNVHCGNFNKVLGLDPYLKGNHTVLGVRFEDLLGQSIITKVGNAQVRVPTPLHQVLMKYYLWAFRGKGELKEQKDARDLRLIIRTFFGTPDALLKTERQWRKVLAPPFQAIFPQDIARIWSAA